jgi:hypothetical protein
MPVSEQYLKDLKSLHSKKSFGQGGKIPKVVEELIKENNVQSILDYGCGKGNTTISLKEAYPDIKIYSYDPATSPIELPAHVDLIISLDVLEHIEPDNLTQTLKDLKERSTMMYHLIACHPAKKRLPDGRNAHLIIEDPQWWETKLKEVGIEIMSEEIVRYTSKQRKKGSPIDVVKYHVVTK